MKKLYWTVVPACLALLGLLLGADESDSKKPGGAKKEASPALNALEKKFQESLTNAVLAGKWRLVEKDKSGKEALGKEADDKYTIRAITKFENDTWLISARIEYGGKDLTVPVPVKVLWAGDTPVITLTNVAIPGLGAFSARVLFYDGYYSGYWSGPGHAGFLSGIIEKAKEPEKPSAEPAPKK